MEIEPMWKATTLDTLAVTMGVVEPLPVMELRL